ncbi:MAG: hypothetical protein HFG20_06970 [Anaerotruncus sp.]|jgi:hypothetical protein|nr:hypothetical protein [Anaerotruncus sp.]
MLSDTINRANLQSIASYLLYGASPDSISPLSYDQRQHLLEKGLSELICRMAPEVGEELADKLFAQLTRLYSLHFEAGLHAGLLLQAEAGYKEQRPTR